MAPLGIEAAGELGTSWMKQLKVRAVFRKALGETEDGSLPDGVSPLKSMG